MTGQLSIDFDRPAPLAVIHGDALTPEERLITRLLQNHRGKDAAVKAKTMEELFNMSNVAVRSTIRHLIEYHGLCIGSSGVGYFMADSPDEIDSVTRSLRHRGISILVRAAKLQKISIEEIFGQAKMELEAQAK